MTTIETYWDQGIDHEIEELVRLVNEAIALELNASRLYALFQDIFPEDAEFWQALSIEEENHANLLRNGRRLFLPEGRFPRELLPESLAPLVEKNQELEALLNHYEQTPPNREEAFRTALVLEESAGELHYQRAMENRAPSWTLKVFQTLNNDDRDHASRIRDYMAALGIAA